MKQFSLCLLILVLAACRDDKPVRSSSITPEKNEVTAGAAGLREKIAVGSDCDWQVGETPQWCRARKIALNGQEYLDLEVDPNEDAASRQTVVRLFCESTVSSLRIFQDGKSETADPLQWAPLPVATLTRAAYELSADGTTRTYRITGDRIFAAPSFVRQVYPGHLVNCSTDYRTLTTYDQYTYNPVRITAFVNNRLYEHESVPSFDVVNEMAQQIIAGLPRQSSGLYLSSPIPYYSYRHLHLLGYGNMGLNLDELVSGKPYTQKEMNKRTGMIYASVHELFQISMDYPEKLVVETIDERDLPDMSYINSIAYGKTSLLVVESDSDFTPVKVVVGKVARGENLSAKEASIRDGLDCRYISFDNSGVHTARGNYSLIERGVEEAVDLQSGIIPLSFTTNKLADNTVGTMEIGLELK